MDGSISQQNNGDGTVLGAVTGLIGSPCLEGQAYEGGSCSGAASD